jgi:hypothetical protein
MEPMHGFDDPSAARDGKVVTVRAVRDFNGLQAAACIACNVAGPQR